MDEEELESEGPTFGQGDDAGDDDEDQSEHLNKGQRHLCARRQGHAPAVDGHHKRCQRQGVKEALVGGVQGALVYRGEGSKATHSLPGRSRF